MCYYKFTALTTVSESNTMDQSVARMSLNTLQQRAHICRELDRGFLFIYLFALLFFRACFFIFEIWLFRTEAYKGGLDINFMYCKVCLKMI